jgi:hypothetical protein
MPKAGKYDYPFFDLDSCVEKLKAYHNVVQTYETTRSLMAETLKMSMTGGGFVNLISSMEKYGLIETGGNNVKITEFGKTILFAEPSEIQQTKKKAVSGIDLFRELYEQYGKDATLEQIRSFLRQKANVDISKVEKMAKSIDTIYKKVLNYIVPAQKLSPTSGMGSGRRETTTGTEKEPLKFQGNGLYIEIASDPKMIDAIEDAKELLTFWEQRLKAKMKKQQNEEEKTAQKS